MDIFFTDPTDIPLPPNEVHIRQLNAEPWPDGKRVRVYLEISPFQIKPNGEISISNQEGLEVASISIIETIDPKMEFTIHLRTADTKGTYQVKAEIFYYEKTDEELEDAEVLPISRPKIFVDHAETSFQIP